MKKFIIITLAVFLSSCTSVKIENTAPEPKSDEKIVYTKEITSQQGKEILEKYNEDSFKTKAGELVLAPTIKDLEKFYENASTPLNFKKYKVMRDDGKFITILDSGEEKQIEKALVIPFPKEENFSKGETILTPGPGSQGFTYAYILKEDDGKFLVRYMDKNIASKVSLLDREFLKKLNGDFVKGARLIVKDEGNFINETLLCACNGFVLTLSEKGILNVRNKMNTSPLQYSNGFKEGDDIFVNIKGVYLPGTILSLDKEKATFNIAYKTNTLKREILVDLIDISKSLE